MRHRGAMDPAGTVRRGSKRRHGYGLAQILAKAVDSARRNNSRNLPHVVHRGTRLDRLRRRQVILIER